MADPLHITFLSVLSVECLLGTSLNAFIVLTHCLEWRQTRRLPGSDKIETCLCVCRFFLQCAITLNNFCRSFSLDINSPSYFIELFLVVRMFLSFTSLWSATLLSVFYCVKITNYNFGIFVFLKPRISRMVPWLVLSCLLVSLASSLPFAESFYTLYFRNSTAQNSTENTDADKIQSNMSLAYAVGSSVPFAIFIIAVLLLIHSLWSHIKQMRSGADSFRSPNLNALLGVVKSLMVFFCLCIIYFVCMNLISSGLLPVGSPWIAFVSILNSSYPFLHSAVLIYTNSKLKLAFLHLLSVIAPKRLWKRFLGKSFTEQ
ncbi:taste receptor type 2 member 40-like [Pseudophryne corroboree]|uniref:taste receptor type 2 member 40-like n=1 Tax=Pseudophryne corroboree TaxID=495146 RepID=UPI0030819A80